MMLSSMVELITGTDGQSLMGLSSQLAAAPQPVMGARILYGAGAAWAGDPMHHAVKLVQTLRPRPMSQEIRAFRRTGQKIYPVPLVTAGPVVKSSSIAAVLESGATVVLQKMDAQAFGWHRLARALESATAQAGQVNLYLAGRASHGLAWHRDPHDVLVIQLAGTKIFWMANAWHLARPMDAVAVSLQAGDVLWLPRGIPHAASNAAGGSLHIALGLLHLGEVAPGQWAWTKNSDTPSLSPGHPLLLPRHHMALTAKALLDWRVLPALPTSLQGGQWLRPDLLLAWQGNQLYLGRGQFMAVSAQEKAQLRQGRLPVRADFASFASRLLPAQSLAELVQNVNPQKSAYE